MCTYWFRRVQMKKKQVKDRIVIYRTPYNMNATNLCMYFMMPPPTAMSWFNIITYEKTATWRCVSVYFSTGPYLMSQPIDWMSYIWSNKLVYDWLCLWIWLDISMLRMKQITPHQCIPSHKHKKHCAIYTRSISRAHKVSESDGVIHKSKI